ncbi:MAG: lipoyl(octanoyl) transferase LipB [Candidatus Berkiellales bacterium]
MLSIHELPDLQDYGSILHKMRNFTLQRTQGSPDEIWLLEHHPVFTQGQAGKAEHLISPGDIPVVQSDRGGQVTYHGPGQLIIYTLFDLPRKKSTLRPFTLALQNSIIDLLKQYGISGHCQTGAPGIYVANAKICSIGLRVRHGCTYHGMSLNVKMDLSPFQRINPCGFPKLKMTQIFEFIPEITRAQVTADLLPLLTQQLSHLEKSA